MIPQTLNPLVNQTSIVAKSNHLQTTKEVNHHRTSMSNHLREM